MSIDVAQKFAERQSEIWMAALPRLTKLGAKWVEVRKRRARGFRIGMMGAYLKTASNIR
jgi:hypothetical protein